MKITLAAGLVLVALVSGMILYNLFVTNPRVADEIRNNPDGERARKAMLLTFADGKMIPVNYLRENGRIYVGADGPWWREFRGEGQSVTMVIRGETTTGHATVELEDQDFVDDIFSRLRPTAPEWLPDWLNGRLVIIEPAQDG